jgi:hypothetical protein
MSVVGERHPCGKAGSVIAIGGTEVKLLLENMVCHGDDSRLCCGVPAYGQPVVATGRLRERDGTWSLHEPTLCVESP